MIEGYLPGVIFFSHSASFLVSGNWFLDLADSPLWPPIRPEKKLDIGLGVVEKAEELMSAAVGLSGCWCRAATRAVVLDRA